MGAEGQEVLGVNEGRYRVDPRRGGGSSGDAHGLGATKDGLDSPLGLPILPLAVGSAELVPDVMFSAPCPHLGGDANRLGIGADAGELSGPGEGAEALAEVPFRRNAEVLENRRQLGFAANRIEKYHTGKLIDDEEKANVATNPQSGHDGHEVRMHALERTADRAGGRGPGKGLRRLGLATGVAGGNRVAGTELAVAVGCPKARSKALVAPGDVAKAPVKDITYGSMTNVGVTQGNTVQGKKGGGRRRGGVARI